MALVTTSGNPSAPAGGRPPGSHRPVWLAPNVFALGVVSFLTDVSSEMIVPLLPVFLGSLGAGALALGWVEGLSDAVSSVLKLFAGRWSDRSGRRLPFLLGGYGLSTLARPLVGFATSAWHVVLVRCVDRVGTGLRGSPRDALIAHSIPESRRGSAFGFHRSMDHAGATVGPRVAIALINGTEIELRSLFLLAALPAFLSVLVVWRGVREVPAPPPASPVHAASSAPAAKPLRGFLFSLGLFTLGKASDLFLLQVLADRQPSGFERAELVQFSLVWIGLHVLKTLAGWPGGRLADRYGRRRVIVLGWLLHGLACVGLAFAETYPMLLLWFALWGLQDGFTEGAQKALVSELAPRDRQGSAFGWYHLTLGLLALAASVLFGALYELAGRPTAFLASATLAVLAAGGIALSQRRRPGAIAPT